MPAIKPFENFKLYQTADKAVIEKYTGVLPRALINIWKEYGFGSFARGFLKTIDPGEYQELLNLIYISDFNPIPILTTALGDMIVLIEKYHKGKKYLFIYIVFCRYGSDSIVYPLRSLDDDDFFKERLTNTNVYKNDLYWEDYILAVKERRIIPEYDECYGYAPLLGAGGIEMPQLLQIVKIKDYITQIKETNGPVKAKGRVKE